MAEPVLELDGVTVGIAHRPILSDVSLCLRAGGWYGLVGQNGCGKTTLMRAALGLLRPMSGTVSLCGTPTPYPAGWAAASFGARLSHPRRKVRTELLLRMAALGCQRGELDRVFASTGLSDPSVCCGDLSLGQAQRLAVVTALLGRPQLVVLDEPTVGLDAAALGWLVERLREYTQAGGCVWVSSHDLSVVEHSADEITVLSGGSMAYTGTVAGLIGDGARTIRLRSSDPGLLRRVLDETEYPVTFDGLGAATVYDCDATALGTLLAGRQVPLVEMTPSSGGLESALDEMYASAGRTPAASVTAGCDPGAAVPVMVGAPAGGGSRSR